MKHIFMSESFETFSQLNIFVQKHLFIQKQKSLYEWIIYLSELISSNTQSLRNKTFDK